MNAAVTAGVRRLDLFRMWHVETFSPVTQGEECPAFTGYEDGPLVFTRSQRGLLYSSLFICESLELSTPICGEALFQSKSRCWNSPGSVSLSSEPSADCQVSASVYLNEACWKARRRVIGDLRSKVTPRINQKEDDRLEWLPDTLLCQKDDSAGFAHDA